MSKVQKTSLDVLSELWAIADEVGHDYIYIPEETGCSYVKWTYDHSEATGPFGELRPGCIVGHWLHKHGVPLSTLESNEGTFAAKWYETYRHAVDFDLTHTAVDFLVHVQGMQDSGRTWGRSIQAAARALDLIEDEEE